jgi:hypothetical protein
MTAVHLEAGREGARWGPKKQQGAAVIGLAPVGPHSPKVYQQGATCTNAMLMHGCALLMLLMLTDQAFTSARGRGQG